MDAADASRWNRESPPPPGGLDPAGSYDEQIEGVANMLIAERACAWTIGDRILRLHDDVVADCRRRGLKPAQIQRYWKAVRKTCASRCHQGDGYIRALMQMSGTFGTEQRYPHVSQALYRACIARGNALVPTTGDEETDAHEKGAKAREILDLALARGWHVSDVKLYGKPEKGPRLKIVATCGGCDAEVRIVVPDGEKTVGVPALPCPVCCAIAWKVGDDASSLAKLGCLEAAA